MLKQNPLKLQGDFHGASRTAWNSSPTIPGGLVACLFLALGGCAESGTQLPAGTGGESATRADPGAPPPDVFAIPQSELARKADAIKVSGTITVKDYTTGIVQVDVTKPSEGTSPPQGIPPMTVAKFKSPGPYELYLPPGTEAVTLSMFLDIKGDGPDAADPKAVFEPNPLKITGTAMTGVDLVLEKLTVEPPPSPPPDASEGGASQPPPGGSGTDTGAPQSGAPQSGAPQSGAPQSGAPGTTDAAAAAPPSNSSKEVADVLDQQLDGAPKADR